MTGGGGGPWPLRLVVVSTIVVGAAYACAFGGEAGARVGGWLMAVGVSGLVSSIMALGALRGVTHPRRVAGMLAAVFLILVAAFVLGLALPAAEGPGATLVFGLPLRAAIVVYGAGLVPLFALPLVYALTFDEARLDTVSQAARTARDAAKAEKEKRRDEIAGE